MHLSDIGQRLRARRELLGMTQARLAGFARLSRSTINQLENGAAIDLGVVKLMALLDLVGLSVEVEDTGSLRRGLLMASRAASVSNKVPLAPAQLAKALATGKLPASLKPPISAFVDEVPLAVVVAAVEEAAAKAQVAPKIIWRHLDQWALDIKSPRKVWKV